jgi:hypothetical protein
VSRLNTEVEKKGKERREAGCKLTAGFDTLTKNFVRETTRLYINGEELSTIYYCTNGLKDRLHAVGCIINLTLPLSSGNA